MNDFELELERLIAEAEHASSNSMGSNSYVASGRAVGLSHALELFREQGVARAMRKEKDVLNSLGIIHRTIGDLIEEFSS